MNIQRTGQFTRNINNIEFQEHTIRAQKTYQHGKKDVCKSQIRKRREKNLFIDLVKKSVRILFRKFIFLLRLTHVDGLLLQVDLATSSKNVYVEDVRGQKMRKKGHYLVLFAYEILCSISFSDHR
jgi:hypothetical protein